MQFADPWLLGLLALPAGYALLGWARRRRPPEAHLVLPDLQFLSGAPGSVKARVSRWLPALRLLCLVLAIVALARPQAPRDLREIRLRSRNIVLALDISSSMKAGDFQPGNRLTVARRVVSDFIQRRHGDLVGLVLFAGRAFLQAPLTPDLQLLQATMKRVDIGMLPDGTAIGTALA
ncbi:MAG TPA: VWA domain-containing protein, partial [Gemmatimonadales bacterium]|nr:VWA domain-containing protein [Gemmatimonadales bacterium]